MQLKNSLQGLKMTTLQKELTFSKSPRSKTKLLSLFRQFIVNAYTGERLYSSLLNFDNITNVSEIEGLAIQYGSPDEATRFFDMIQEQENSITPVSDAIFAFSRRYDNKWYLENVSSK